MMNSQRGIKVDCQVQAAVDTQVKSEQVNLSQESFHQEQSQPNVQEDVHREPMQVDEQPHVAVDQQPHLVIGEQPVVDEEQLLHIDEQPNVDAPL